MIRKRLITLVSAVLMSLGVVAIASPPAQAVEWDYTVDVSWDGDSSKECINFAQASACLQPAGDLIWLQDKNKDGKSVWVTWEDLDGDRSGTCFNKLGVDAGWTWCNKNFPEGHEIMWKMHYYYYDGSRGTTHSLYTTM